MKKQKHINNKKKAKKQKKNTATAFNAPASICLK